MSHFRVINSGPLSTVQDTGRQGQFHLGLTEGGAMDYRSFALANRLVHNPIDAAAIEITLGGLQLECLQATNICLTGAYCPLTINDKAMPLWQAHLVQAGDIIKVGFAALGVRAYLAVAGGFDCARFFGSQSVVLRDGIGAALAKGDLLTCASPAHAGRFKLGFSEQPSLRNKATLRFVPGYQWSQLAQQHQYQFLEANFTVSSQNNRMGYQLEGPAITTGIRQLYSEGICLGSIQITGSGQPIVLMRDHQTIGGYPKLGAVISPDLDILAQLSQRAEIRFEPISPADAISLMRNYQHNIDNAYMTALD